MEGEGPWKEEHVKLNNESHETRNKEWEDTNPLKKKNGFIIVINYLRQEVFQKGETQKET